MRRAATARGPALGAGDLAALSAVTGLRLQSFRSEHVADRIVRAHAAERVNGNGDLAALLRRDERARERFRRSVAVSHSGFFRDPEQFDALEQRVLPRLLDHTAHLRAWSAGCANGLELWSLAIVLNRLGGLERATLPQEAERLRSLGYERVRAFRWELAAQATLDAYRRADI